MKDAIEFVKELLEKYGLKAGTGILLLTAGVVLLVFNKDKPSLFWSGITLIAISLIILFPYLFPSKPHDSTKRIQVIAWKGWEEPDLHKEQADQMDMLLYERGFDRLPNLEYGGNPFDLLVVDLAYVRMNHSYRRIKDMSSYGHDSLWNKLPVFIQSLAGSICRRGTGERLAVPVEFGFSELLVCPSKFSGELGDTLKELHSCHASWVRGDAELPPPTLSYKDFELNKLLADYPDLKIGLWDWYLPSILHLLLLDSRPDEQIERRGIAEAVASGSDLVNRALKPILTHKSGVFKTIGDPKAITADIREGKLHMVIGSGSSALPLGNRKNVDCVPIVPREGVFTWMNCATIVNECDQGDDGVRSLLEAWFSSETQKSLSESDEYRALPAVMSVFDDLLETHPALPTLYQVTHTNDHRARFVDELPARDVPRSSFRLWQHAWEKAVEGLDKDTGNGGC